MTFGDLAPADTVGVRQPSALSLLVDINLLAYNEENDLGPCVRRLHAHLPAEMPYSLQITVVGNASTDTTLEVANRQASQFPSLRVVHLPEMGRGRVPRAVVDMAAISPDRFPRLLPTTTSERPARPASSRHPAAPGQGPRRAKSGKLGGVHRGEE